MLIFFALHIDNSEGKMNNSMFYYPPYPYNGEMMDEFYINEERTQSNLYTPEEALMYGNAYKDEYLPYKDYKVKKIIAKNEKERLFLIMLAYKNISHDIQLQLDENPNDKKKLKDFIKYRQKYEETKKNYESTYDAICPDGTKDNRFDYVMSPSGWLRRD